MKGKCQYTTLKELIDQTPCYSESEFPKVTIIIPTFNSHPVIGITLDNLLNQEYPDFEVIIIDAGSTDRTSEAIKSLKDNRIRMYTVSNNSRYEMINKGLTHATGSYINILFPGDFYLYRYTLREMMTLALENKTPSMVYCGALIREGDEVKILYRQLTLRLLRSGRQPTSLQSCWFRNDVFKRLGKFNNSLYLRGGYDLMCRLMLEGSMKSKSTTRVLTDYDLRSVTRPMVFLHFYETMGIINEYFGFWSVVKWLFRQKDSSRFVKSWIRSLKFAFIGKT